MTIHVQEADVVRDFAKLMEHVRAGDEVCFETGDGEIVTLSSKAKRPQKDTVALLRAYEAEHGPILGDEAFADDLEEAHRSMNQPLDTSKWD